MDHIDRETQLGKGRDESAIARTTYQLLLALNYMHQRGVCHRDLKPNNIMFEHRKYGPRNSFIRLIDFGFAVKQS